MNCLSLKLNVTHDNHVTITWPVVLYLVLCKCINTVSQCQQRSVDVSSLSHPGPSVWGHGSSLWSSKVDETHFRMSHLSAEASCARLLVDKYLRRCNKNIIYLFSQSVHLRVSLSLSSLFLTWKTAWERDDVALASVGCCVRFLFPDASILNSSSADLG